MSSLPMMGPVHADFALAVFLLSAFLAAGLGAGVAMFERFTAPSRRFFLVAGIVGFWVAILGLARAAAGDPAAVDLWLRLAYLAVPLTVPAMYWMAAALSARPRRIPPGLFWLLGIAFSAINLLAPWLVDGLRSVLVRGTLSGWGWLGAIYLGLELLGIGLTARELFLSRRGALSGAERTEKLLLAAAAVFGGLTMLDYLLARDPFRAGLLTPVGVLGAIALVTLVAVRYRMFAPGESFARDEVLSAMADAVLVCDGAGRIRGSNTASHAQTLRTEAWLHGRPIGEVLGWTRDGEWEGWDGACEGREMERMKLRSRSGETTDVSVSVQAIEFGGRSVGAVVVARDVSEQLRNERALQAAQLRYRALYHHHPAVVHEFDTEGMLTTLNPEGRRLLGLADDEPIQRFHWSYHVHPEDVDLLDRLFSGVLEGASEQYEVRLRGLAGYRHVRGVAVPIRDGEEVVGIFGIGLDVTEEERTKRELEVQRRYFAELFESLPEGVALVDSDDSVVRVNPEFTRLFGFAPDEVVGRTLNELIVPEDQLEEAVSLNRATRSGGLVRTETVRRRRDGSLVDVSLLARNLEIPGAPEQHYGIYRDISGRRAAERALQEREEELRHAQKLEAVGKLAGGIAHDFNNLLTVINGHARFALERVEPDCPLGEDLVEIEKAGVRAASLTQQLLAFSRRQVLRPEVLDANTVVREVQAMLRRLIPAHIGVETDLASSDVRVRADRGQLEQVLVNLIMNARDAMPEGGTLTLHTSTVTLDPSDPRRASWEVEPGTYACLAVEDTGCGMDAHTAERAFEPFFTTKEQGKGTGLGLATVFGIVKQSGGHVTVHSRPGHGTRCEVILPLAEGPAVQTVSLGSDAEPDPVGGRVLVVEDESAVRRLAVRVLERDGYTVLSAENGVRALQLLDDQPEPVDLVITDLVMPEMGGRELARRLGERHPGLPVLCMSGYDEDLVGDDFTRGFLPKPFTPDALLHRVAEQLGAVTGMDEVRRLN